MAKTYQMQTETIVIPKRGQEARDILSGWAGRISAVYVYLNGCIRVEISGKDKDEKPEAYVFDLQQVQVTGPSIVLFDLPSAPARLGEIPPVAEPAAAPRRGVGGPRDTAPVPR